MHRKAVFFFVNPVCRLSACGVQRKVEKQHRKTVPHTEFSLCMDFHEASSYGAVEELPYHPACRSAPYGVNKNAPPRGAPSLLELHPLYSHYCFSIIYII